MNKILKKSTGVIFGLSAFILSFLLFESSAIYSMTGSDIFRALERTGLDVLTRARGTREWSNKIMMVKIDDWTDRNLGWPIPRDQYGAVMALLSGSGAVAVALDVPLPPREREDMSEEEMMAAYLEGARGIFPVIGPFIPAGVEAATVSSRNVDSSAHFVIGRFGIPAPQNHLFPRSPFINDYPFPGFANASSGVGHISIIPDSLDGVIRSAPLFVEYAGRLYPTLGLALALYERGATTRDMSFERLEDGMIFRAKDIEVRTGREGEVMINYLGPEEVLPKVSFADILFAARDGNEEFFKQFDGKICIIGPTVRSLGDFYATPIAESTPGYITHANIYDMITTGQFLSPASRGAQFFILLILSLLIGAVAQLSNMKVGVSLLITTLIAYLAVAFFLFQSSGIWIHVVEPIFALSLAFVGTVSYRAATEGRQKRMITDMFGKYVDSTVVKTLVDNPSMFRLGGEKKEITLLFTDIKGFSTISEKISEEKLVKLMNTYFTEMTKIITSHKGTVDKYIGDAIMAFWGAPLTDPDSAFHACTAALQMQKRLTDLQPKLEQFVGMPVKQRVGVNTGVCTVGNMGSASKVNYTAIGDPVNLASRLEGVNKQYGTNILVSEMTYLKAKGKVLVREVDRVVVVGKSEPVRIFELLSMDAAPKTDKDKLFLETYHEGLKAYQERRWDEGIAYMEHAMTYWPEDPVCQLYIERMRLYQIHPPKPEWNGVFVLDSK